MTIESKGNVIVKMTLEKQMTLKDVLYAPNTWKNLVSRSAINKHGSRFIFESNKFVLTKNGTYVGKPYDCGRMFKLNVMAIKPKINDNSSSSAYILESSNLWHGRLELVNYDSFKLAAIINVKLVLRPNLQGHPFKRLKGIVNPLN